MRGNRFDIMRKAFVAVLLIVLPQTLMFSYGANRYLSYKEIQTLIHQGEDFVAQNKNVEATKVLMQAKLQAEESGFDDLLYQANINLGNIYYNIEVYGESMAFFFEAYDLVKDGDDWQKIADAKNGIAAGYYSEKNYAKASELMEECLAAALKANDSIAVVDFALNQVRTANMRHHFDDAKKHIDMAQRYLSKGYAEEIIPYMKHTQMEMYYMHGKYDQAVPIAEQLLLQADYPQGKVAALNTMAEICCDRRQYAEAIGYARQALPLSNMGRQVKLYNLMADCYAGMGHRDSVVCYKDSALVCCDSIQNKAGRDVVEKSRVQFESNGIRQQFRYQQEKLARTRLFIIILLVVIAFVVCFTAYYIMDMRRKKRENDLLHEKERHQQQLDMQKKNQELTLATLITSSRNEIVSELISQIQDISGIQSNVEVKTLIGNLKQQLRDSVNQDDFRINFERAHPFFARNIMEVHPDLLPGDMRFLAYVMQDITTSEIASLLNITTDSCKRKKIRISKKLGLESSTMLRDYLQKFM